MIFQVRSGVSMYRYVIGFGLIIAASFAASQTTTRPVSPPILLNNTAMSQMSTEAYSSVYRAGYATAGDSPTLLYTASGSACSLNAGAGDGGSQVPSSNGKCWLAQFNEPIDVRSFGAKCDNNNATDDAGAIQNALNAGIGKAVRLPQNRACYIRSTITASGPIDFGGYGSGSGAGGISNDSSTLISYTGFTTGDMFVCNSAYTCVLHDFHVEAASGDRVSDAGIHLKCSGSCGNTNTSVAYSIIHNVSFSGQYYSIIAEQQAQLEIHHTYHQRFGRAAVKSFGTPYIAGPPIQAGVESQLHFHHNYVFDTKLGTGSSPAFCMEIYHGYLDFHSNNFIGCQISTAINCSIRNCGTISFQHNNIEDMGIGSILIDAGNGAAPAGTGSIAYLNISNNEFSSTNSAVSTANLTIGGVQINPFINGATLEELTISNNHVKAAFTNAVPYCFNLRQNVLYGTAIIADNMCIDSSGAPGAYGYIVQGTGYTLKGNKVGNIGNAKKYLFTAGTLVTLIDNQGIDFGNIGTLDAPQNGSQLFITDGTPGGACVGAGTGSMAFRQNAAWNCF